MDSPVSNFLNTVLPFAIVVNNINPNCTFYQELEFGQVYYIFNKEYPKNYTAKSACQWTAISPINSKILLSCGEISMPKVSLNSKFQEFFKNNCMIFFNITIYTTICFFLQTDNFQPQISSL